MLKTNMTSYYGRYFLRASSCVYLICSKEGRNLKKLMVYDVI